MSQNGRKLAKMLHNAAKKFDWIMCIIKEKQVMHKVHYIQRQIGGKSVAPTKLNW